MKQISTVSIALCTHNGGVFLGEQLKSIQYQSFQPNEIIICDDISTDTTVHIIQQFQQKYPDIIQFFVNEQRLGPRKYFEKAIALTTGDVIFLSDQDDIWPTNKTTAIVKEFAENTNFPTVNTCISSASASIG